MGSLHDVSRRVAGLAVLAPMLAACCTGVTTDPRRGGLAGGVCGATTGAYEERLAVRRAELASLDDAHARLSRHLASNRSEADDLSRRIENARHRAEARAASAAAMDTEIEQLRERRAVSQAELATLEAESAQLGRELAGHMERTRRTELAARALREGATASADRTTIEAAEARNREKGEELDRRLADLRRRMSPAGQ